MAAILHDLKISGFAVEFARCVWKEVVSGKKKLRIQKYPDTRGRRLKEGAEYKFLRQVSRTTRKKQIFVRAIGIHKIGGSHVFFRYC